MTDQEIGTARRALNILSARCADGAFLFKILPWAIGKARVALKPLGDRKATAFLDEFESLTQRMKDKTHEELLPISWPLHQAK
jgi:hypothetical protein